jgi:hypothetical protein
MHGTTAYGSRRASALKMDHLWLGWSKMASDACRLGPAPVAISGKQVQLCHHILQLCVQLNSPLTELQSQIEAVSFGPWHAQGVAMPRTAAQATPGRPVTPVTGAGA